MTEDNDTRKHLALGEYVYPGANGDLPPDVARSLFFETIRAHAPEVLQTLADRPFKLYLRLRRRYASYEIEPLMVHKGLRKWAQPYSLQDEWCLVWAFKTLDHWCIKHAVTGYDPSTDAQRQWGPPRNQFSEVPDFTMEELGFSVFWHPLFEDRPSVLRRINRELDAIDAKARARGCVKPKEVRQWEDFTWLVRFQIKRERYATIADSRGTSNARGLTDSAIHAQVVDLAKKINLTLRKTPTGRRSNAEICKIRKETSI